MHYNLYFSSIVDEEFNRKNLTVMFLLLLGIIDIEAYWDCIFINILIQADMQHKKAKLS